MALQKLKFNLSHLRQNSWHSKLVHFAYGKQTQPKKACPYWWFIVPTSSFIAGVKLICLLTKQAVTFAFALMFSAAGLLFFVLGVLFGYKMSEPKVMILHPIKGLGESNGIFEGPYDWRIKPYQVIFPAAFVVGCIVLTRTSWPWLLKVLIISVSAIAVITALGLLYKKIAHPILKKVCPDITWTDQEDVVAP